MMPAPCMVEIAPTPEPVATPLELLEDFADAQPGWMFLEEDSGFYAQLKGAPACILRHVHASPELCLDLVFTAQSADDAAPLTLTLVAAAEEGRPELPERCEWIVDRFADAFSVYLRTRREPAVLRLPELSARPLPS